VDWKRPMTALEMTSSHNLNQSPSLKPSNFFGPAEVWISFEDETLVVDGPADGADFASYGGAASECSSPLSRGTQRFKG